MKTMTLKPVKRTMTLRPMNKGTIKLVSKKPSVSPKKPKKYYA